MDVKLFIFNIINNFYIPDYILKREKDYYIDLNYIYIEI